MKRKLTPQEKKRHSLRKDHPLMAEAPKAFRKKRPKSKRIAQKMLRARIRDHLSALRGTVDTQVLEATDTTKYRRKIVRKWVFGSLAEVIALKKECRERSRGRKNRSRFAKTAELLLREAIPDLLHFTVYSADPRQEGEVDAVVGYQVAGGDRSRWAKLRVAGGSGGYRILSLDLLDVDW